MKHHPTTPSSSPALPSPTTSSPSVRNSSHGSATRPTRDTFISDLEQGVIAAACNTAVNWAVKELTQESENYLDQTPTWQSCFADVASLVDKINTTVTDSSGVPQTIKNSIYGMLMKINGQQLCNSVIS